jgi:hypothetical protein
MARITITLTVSYSWWVIPYLSAVDLFSQFIGLEPDYDRVVATALRGLKIKAVDER